jgi:hypothetical protein
MNITITPENVYMGICLVLLGLQMYQQVVIRKQKKEINKLWDQMATMAAMVAMKFLETQKDFNKLNDKN